MPTNPFRVINVVSHGKIMSDWYQQLEALLWRISKGSDRLASNYSPERMNLEQHLTFDLLVNSENEIVSFSGIFNGGRYPDGVCRVLNRMWLSESERVSHGNFSMLASRYILPEQIRKNRKDLKFIFVSRSRLSGRLFLKKWMQKQNSEFKWQLSENLVQVVPQIENKDCYQYICYSQVEPVLWEPKVVSKEAWMQLPDGN